MALMKLIFRWYVLVAISVISLVMVLIFYQFHVLATKHHDQHYQPYPEDIQTSKVGQPSWLDAVRRYGATHNLASLDLDKMTGDQLFMILHSYLDNIDVICKRKLRMGNINEGGWEVCDDIDVRPTPPCIVYSYGINNDWTFDDDISKLYGCHVFSFDPSIQSDTHNRSDLVHFYKLGISGQSYINKQKWQLYRHEDLRVLLKHERSTIDVIKMDVENAEWSALDDMVTSDQFKNVRQLFIEFHVFKKNITVLEKLKTLRSLEVAGFQRFYVHKNKSCKLHDSRFPVRRTFCYEVHYIKR
uniref:Methyltransferase domain-containing protein n=1 Tax=Arion vulgaris TaxID=1028688 RepID=A0A0B7A6J9_9EUPU